MIGRRALVALGAGGTLIGALAGCGFRPMYMQTSRGGPGPSADLAAVYVPVGAERSGQLLRQALQRRFEGTGTGVAKKYDIVPVFAISQEGIAIQRDSSTTRIRVVGTVTYVLRELNLAHTALTSGSARVLDGYNILNQQYFAADLENETVIRRVAESLADQITLQLAAWFRKRDAGGPAGQPAGPAPGAAPASSIPPDAATPDIVSPGTESIGRGPF